MIGRPGSDRLSRVLRRSIMGAEAFHGRVRNGIGCSHLAKTTRSANRIMCLEAVVFREGASFHPKAVLEVNMGE